MRIFYLAQRVPFPPNRGDKIATFNQISRLAKNHEIEVFCLADIEEDESNVRGLEALAVAVNVVPLSPGQARLRALIAMAGRRPLTLAYLHEPEFRRILEDRYHRAPPDAVVVYGSGLAQYVESWSATPRIMQFADLDSMKWREYAKRSRPPMCWVYRVEAARLIEYERYLARTFSRSVLSTEEEKLELESSAPGVIASSIVNGVDLEYFERSRTPKELRHLVFTGVMNYYPNVDGMVWFCREILPLVRRDMPDAQLTICGSRPTREVQALAKYPGVTVTGRIPDVRVHLAAAEVAIVPLRVARGIQNKLLEAMAMSLPCVATPVAATGIRAMAGRDLFVADGAEEFADRVIRLLRDPGLRDRMGAAARNAVEVEHNWDSQVAKLEAILLSAIGDPRPVRVRDARFGNQ